MNVARGDIVLVNLEPVLGSEQGKTRPCLVVQNDVGNKFSPTTIVLAITSTIPINEYPTAVLVEPRDSGLSHESTILCNQIRTISVKDRIIKKIGRVTPDVMSKVNSGLRASLEI